LLKLIGTDGSRYYSWELPPGKYSIGRKEESDLPIPNKTVSRNHAELEILSDGENGYLRDLGSRNGTAVNGVKLSERVRIKEGDTIMFGQGEFRLTAEDGTSRSTSRPTATLAEVDPEKSVFMSIDEALKPVPAKVTDLPDVFPTLSEMARMLLLHEPEQVMLENSLKLVSRVIPAERLAVLYTSEDQEEIYAATTLLPGEGKDPGEFTLSRTIVREILTEKQAVLIGDPESDPRYAEAKSIIISDMKSAMAVPLFDEGKVLGILYADTTSPLHRYNDDYLRLFATFGNIIASRLVNYTLLREREEKKVLEVELGRASKIQQKLLVADSPEVPGYNAYAFQQQCRAVGGDLYDMITLPDGRFLFLVGDVSGKGMGAALLMGNILASFRILYGQAGFNLLEAVALVSRQLFNFSNPGDFATLFVGVLDISKNELVYVNAGHNPPVVVSRDGAIRELDATGFMIGAFDSGDWQEETISLADDDLLFVFSDGVTEAEGKNEFYGEERMNNLISGARNDDPRKIAEQLMNDIQVFVEDTPRSDDITMLFVKRSH